MRVNTIIHRYIFIEMIPPFLLTMAFFIFIILTSQILKITSMIVNYKISIISVMKLLFFTIPVYMKFIIPMSVMMAVLMTFLRMSGDKETIALKAGGMSIYNYLPPVLIFALIGCIMTAFTGIYALPWGKQSFKNLAFSIATSNMTIGLKQKTFNNSFNGVMLYVNEIDIKTGTLKDIFIEDQRSEGIKTTITAPAGLLSGDPANLSFRLRLLNGNINTADPGKKSVHSSNFEEYDLKLDLKNQKTKLNKTLKEKTIMSETEYIQYLESKSREEMSVTELIDYIKFKDKKRDAAYYRVLMELHEKFSIAIACFALGILALPLGLQSTESRKSTGIVTSLILFLCHYLLITIGWSFGESGKYPPAIGMWAPNIIIGGLGLYLTKRSAEDRPVEIANTIISMKLYIKSTFKKKHDNKENMQNF